MRQRLLCPDTVSGRHVSHLSSKSKRRGISVRKRRGSGGWREKGEMKRAQLTGNETARSTRDPRHSLPVWDLCGQHKAGYSHNPPKHLKTFKHFPWWVCSVCLCLLVMTASKGMRFKFCTWNNTGATVVGVDTEIISLLPFCSVLLDRGKPVSPGRCPSCKAPVFQPRRPQRSAPVCQRSALHSITRPALPCPALPCSAILAKRQCQVHLKLGTYKSGTNVGYCNEKSISWFIIYGSKIYSKYQSTKPKFRRQRKRSSDPSLYRTSQKKLF